MTICKFTSLIKPLSGLLAKVLIAVCTLLTVELPAQSLDVIKKATKAEATVIQNNIALYDYYLGNYFDSLTQLAIVQAKGYSISDTHTQIIQAGIYFTFDLDNAAFDILNDQFTSDSQTIHDPIFQTKSWFDLAQQFYKKGNFPAARKALLKIKETIPSHLGDHFYYLQAQLFIKEGKIDQAEQVITKMSTDSINVRYLNFNLASQLVAQEQMPLAIEKYKLARQVNPQTPANEIIDAIVDKANLALGYLYIRQKKYSQAIDAFKLIPLNGMGTESAMLGYGWAAASLNQYQTALAIWQQLSERKTLTPFVREAFIAIPYVYERLAQGEKAYQSFQSAITRFEQQRKNLVAEIAETQQPGFLLELLQSTQPRASSIIGKQAIKARRSVEIQFPHFINTFTEVSSNEFQQGLRDIQDLNIMIEHLFQWQKEITEIKHENSQVRAPSKKTVPVKNIVAELQQLTKMHQKLQIKINDAKALQAEIVTNLTAKIEQGLTKQLAQIKKYLQAAKLASVKYNDEIFMLNHPLNEQRKFEAESIEQQKRRKQNLSGGTSEK